MKKLSALLLFVVSAPVFAESHHKGTFSSLNLGIRYSSILQNRGVILYRDFQIDPVVGVFLFDDRLEFLGDSIGFRDFIYEDRVRLRTRIVTISDKPLFPAYVSVRERLPERHDSYEWSNRIEWFLPGYNDSYRSEVDLEYAKDFVAHHGSYAELQGKLKLFDFDVSSVDAHVEPNLFASIGWGDRPHNRYFYGPSSEHAGFDNLAYGLWLAFPKEADRFYPIVQLKYFKTLEPFKNSEYALGRSEGLLLSFIATYGAWE